MLTIITLLHLTLPLFPCLNPDFHTLDQLITHKISQSQFTGLTLGIYSSDTTLYKKSYGTLYPKCDLYAPPVTLETVFDIGYLTQVIGINSGLMELHDGGKIGVKDRVGRHLGEFQNNGKRDVSIENLLMHNSGLQATITGETLAPNPAELMKKINNLKLEYKEESKFQYSELGFVVLGEMISKINKKNLNDSLHQIMLLAGLRQTSFGPSTPEHLIAPSFHEGRVIRGKPSNRIAAFLDSMAGNAGLFSILDNLGSYMQLMLNKGKRRLELPIFTQATVQLFTTRVEMKGYKNTRALGWETVPAVDPPCGSKFSKNSFGIGDPSGSFLWADKEKNVAIVVLVAGFPVGGGLKASKVQGEISDSIMTALGY